MYKYYHFINPKSEIVEDHFLDEQEYTTFMKDNPTWKETIGSPMITTSVGAKMKTDKEFDGLLKKVKKENKNSKINVV